MNEHSHVRIESPLFSADQVHVIGAEGRETISRLFELHVDVVSSDPAGLEVDALIGSPATLVFERAGAEIRRLGGIVAGIRDSMHEETGRLVYHLWLAPRAFRLSLVETCEIFMDISVPGIVKKKLERAGLSENQDFELRLAASYPEREFVVQYRETDLAFVSRLLEHVGISFFFEHRDGVDVLVLTDNNAGFSAIGGRKEVHFRSRGERLGVFAIEAQTRMTPAHYLVKDYNYRTPQLALQASAATPNGDGGYVLEYGAHFKDPEEGAQIAKIRAEEVAASRTVLDGKSDCQPFGAGAMFVLEEHPRGDMELLLVEVRHKAASSALGAGKESARDYENEFRAIPYKTPYRPARLTPKPRIVGVVTGVIDAAARGPLAELDAEGRYRVRFLFDAGNAPDGKASRLCRMAQPHGGGGYGMHFPLRSGVEVILTFVDGDPDRPIILGVVPNPQTPSPVTAGNGTRNIIRTGAGNEINIDDTAGGERIKMSTPFGKSVLQIGQKNAEEQGIIAQTEEHMSTKATKSINAYSKISNAVSDVCRILSASDITQYCTPFLNFTALASAAIGGAGNTADVIKSGLNGGLEDGIQGFNEVSEEKEKEAREVKKDLEDERKRTEPERTALSAEKQKHEVVLEQKEKEKAARNKQMAEKKKLLAEKKATLAAKRAALRTAAKADSKALKAEIAALEAEVEGLEAEIAVLEAEIAVLEAEIGTEQAAIAQANRDIEALDRPASALEKKAAALEDEAETAKRLAERAKKQFEETTAGKVSAHVDDYVKAPLGNLVSTFGDAAGFFAQNAADLKAGELVLEANVAADGGRMTHVVLPVVGSPKFIGGGTMNAALVSGMRAFVGSNISSTLFSGLMTAVLSNGRTAVKGSDTELSGLVRVQVTSNALIDLESAVDMKLVATAGWIEAKAGTEFKLSAGGKMSATASGMHFTSKKDAMLVAEEGPVTLIGRKKDFGLKADEGNMFLRAAKEKSKVDLKDDKATFSHQDWGVTVKSDCIEIGKHARKEEDLRLSDSTITMKREGGVVSVKNNDVFLKGGSAQVKVTSAGVTVTGSRINLG